ncbi:hypothetical protein GQ53DRAFT_771312 [Thozetella sp. PMI_491]|nr:hypothetical protein GQ53DRAFT_771312 [Thozetella sp. PMI_491]
MGLFFVSWELWQQMTFVLAMAIVVVFVMGLVKLWWNNRLMRKQEIIDEEKRARMTDMRRAGLSVKRGNDIPFGVRAIQSGVEVAGIWISRPATPSLESNAKIASSTTLVGVESNSEKKAKYAEETRPAPTFPLLDRTTSDRSILQTLNDTESLNSTPSITPPLSHFASQTRKPNVRTSPVLSEDSLRRLESHSQARSPHDIYMPTSGPHNPRRPSQRSSASSSGGESMDSQSRSTRSTSGKSYSSSRSSRLYTSRNTYESRLNYSTLPPESPDKDSRDPFGTPARTPSGFSAFSQDMSEAHSSLAQSQELPTPQPTFGPGDMHFNKTSRRVNAGFEVLPAGTFGPPQGTERTGSRTDLGSDSDGSRDSTKQQNKLRKKSISQLPRGSPMF